MCVLAFTRGSGVANRLFNLDPQGLMFLFYSPAAGRVGAIFQPVILARDWRVFTASLVKIEKET
jgi:hypothetical protein